MRTKPVSVVFIAAVNVFVVLGILLGMILGRASGMVEANAADNLVGAVTTALVDAPASSQ